MGGGVMQHAQLFELIRQELAGLLNGYIRAREVIDGLDQYVIPPQFGDRAGVLGALALAEQAYRGHKCGVGSNPGVLSRKNS
jgi:fructokinase